MYNNRNMILQFLTMENERNGKKQHTSKVYVIHFDSLTYDDHCLLNLFHLHHHCHYHHLLLHFVLFDFHHLLLDHYHSHQLEIVLILLFYHDQLFVVFHLNCDCSFVLLLLWQPQLDVIFDIAV